MNEEKIKRAQRQRRPKWWLSKASIPLSNRDIVAMYQRVVRDFIIYLPLYLGTSSLLSHASTRACSFRAAMEKLRGLGMLKAWCVLVLWNSISTIEASSSPWLRTTPTRLYTCGGVRWWRSEVVEG